MTYQQALSRQNDPLSKCEVVRLYLYDDCMVALRKDGKQMRMCKEDRKLFHRRWFCVVMHGNYTPNAVKEQG